MQLYIDTANLNEIQEIASWGIISGVTTNPSLMAKEKNWDREAILKEIVTLVDGPISIEVVSTKAKDMVVEGVEFAAWHKNVVVKVPSTPEGLKAVYQLAKQNIRTNVTLCFNANQALFAARAGAYIISPFIGRIDDIGMPGMHLIEEVVTIYQQHAIETKVLAASLRHPRHITEAALAGADIATCPYKVLVQSMQHPLTDIGLEKFLADWKASQ